MSGNREARLVLLAVQRVRGETGREHRVTRAEPTQREEKETREEERGAQLRQSARRTGSAVDRWNDLEIPLEPDPGEAHEREQGEGGRVLLRLHAQKPDERNHEDENEHRHADGTPGTPQPVKDEIR